MSRKLSLVLLLLAAGVVLADDVRETEPVVAAAEARAEEERSETESVTAAAAAPAGTKEDPKPVSGMSILGNQEAPKSLVIVPWKSSELGASLGISAMLDESRRPVDKEVFMRALSYYEIRSERTP